MLQQQSVTLFSFFLQDDHIPLHLASLYHHVEIVSCMVQRLTKNGWKELLRKDKVRGPRGGTSDEHLFVYIGMHSQP